MDKAKSESENFKNNNEGDQKQRRVATHKALQIRMKRRIFIASNRTPAVALQEIHTRYFPRIVRRDNVRVFARFGP